MNNTQVDYLVQVPPRPETAPTPVRPRDDAPAFDSHFRQASGPSGPPPPPTTSPSPAAPPQPAQATDHPAQPTNTSTSSADPPASDDSKLCVDDEHEAIERDADDAAETTATNGPAAPVVVTPTDGKAVAEKAVAVAIDGKQIGGAQEASGTIVPTKPATVRSSPVEQHDAVLPASEQEQLDADVKPAEAAAKPVTGQSLEKVVAAPITDQLPNVGGEKTASDALAAEATATKQPEGEPRIKSKSNKNTTGNTRPVPASESGEKQTQARPSAPTRTIEVAAAVSVENPAAAAAGNESSATQPDEKQIETKAVAATEDDSTPDRPRVAAVSRATSLTPTVPVAANVDPSQPSAAAPPNAPESDLKPQEIKPATKEGLLSPFTRLERGGPVNSHANRLSGDREAAPNVDPARFVSRVARAVHTAHERGGPLQLRLSPPELGTMRLEITVHEGALSATIETDNATARQVLLDNLPALRDRLAEQNVRIERFDVDVRRDGTGDGSNGRPNPGPQERGHHRHGEPTPHRTNTGRAASQTTSDTPSPIRQAITNTSINVIA